MHESDRERLKALEREVQLLKAELERRGRATSVENSEDNDCHSYHILFEEAPLPYHSLNETGNIIRVNKAWLRHFGYTADEVIGRNIRDFLTDKSREKLNFQFPVYLEQGGMKGEEYEFICRDQSSVYLLVEGTLRKEANGKLSAIHCILTDITDKKRSEKVFLELRKLAEENEERYRLLIEVQEDLVIKTDAEGHFLYVSPSYCALFGKEEEELLGNSFTPILDDNYETMLVKVIDQLSRAPWISYLEQKTLTVKGWVWLAWNVKAVLDHQKNIVAYVGAGRDITAKKVVEEKLRESEGRLSGVLEAINHGVWEWRVATNEVYFDERYYTIAGYEPGDFEYAFDEWIKRIHPDDLKHVMTALEQHLHGGEDIFDTEFRFLKKDSSWIWLRGRGKVMERDADGNPLRMLGTHSDMSRRKLVEEQLLDRDRKMANLMSKIPGMAYRCRIDAEWTMEYLSEGCRGLTGYDPEDFIDNQKRSFNSIILPEFRDHLWNDWEKNLNERHSFSDEYKILTRQGNEKWVWEQGSVMKDALGNITGLEGIILDITERKRAELIHQFQYKVATNLVTTRNVQELLGLVAVELRNIFDYDGLIVGSLSRAKGLFETIFEMGPDLGLPTWPVKNSLSGFVIQQKKGMLFTDESIRELIHNGTIKLYGTMAKCWMGAPLIYEREVIGVILVQSYNNRHAYDNTSLQVLEIIANQLSIYIEQKRALVRTSQLSKGIEQSPVSIVITDNQGSIEFVNPSFTRITGYTLEEVIGKNPRILRSDEHDHSFYKHLWQTILSGNNWDGEFRNIKKNGDQYWEKTIISPIFNDRGKIVQFIAFKEDITEKRKMMADLVKAKEKAEESDRLKSAFLANLSHEIRTPMNAILGFTELLQDPEITAEAIGSYVSIIHRSGYHLLAIINDIIEISKIETGQITPRYANINIGAVIRDLYTTLKVTIPDEKAVQLRIEPEQSTEDYTIFSDEVKLTQVLTNLISNALKFTGEGVVKFGYRHQGDWLEFRVKDSGIGIDEANHELIFDRFYQVDGDIRIKSGGSGLGLAISKAYIEMLGGTISVKSSLGQGAEFIFTIPKSRK